MSQERDNTQRTTDTPPYPNVGILTTWNQRCGLATYARYLVEQLSEQPPIILAEHTAELTRKDESFVTRCWERCDSKNTNTSNYAELEKIIIQKKLQILHINAHARFFEQTTFSSFLDSVRSYGVIVIAHIHSFFSYETAQAQVIKRSDYVLVHSPESRLEAIAHGANPESVEVVPHGVPLTRSGDHARESIRNKLALPLHKKIICAFGFVQPHKGMESVLETVLHLRQKGIDAFGIIVGQPHAEDPRGREYLAALQQLTHNNGLTQHILFVTDFVTDERVFEYLTASDLVVMNYRSQHFEASGACALALASGATVMASVAPPMMSFADAVWHLTAGFPAALSAELLLNNEALRAEIQRRASEYCQKHSWQAIAMRMREIYHRFQTIPAGRNVGKSELSKEMVVTNKSGSREKRLRVLMQNRPQALSLRGGDTVVMERLKTGLESRGMIVTVDLEGVANPAHFDLVHLFNFATPDLTRMYAERAVKAGIPFVVTTLYEDVPAFHTQSHAVAGLLIRYVYGGQNKEWYDQQDINLDSIATAPKFDNAWTAEHAAALLVNGATEGRTIQRDFPECGTIVEVKLGHEVGKPVGPELFVRQYGISDFILCVGRFESRKNQLMLLKALEDSELPIVLVSGGFSYQPDYDKAVRGFGRRGQTVIVERLSDEMLSSAYAACRIHALPSWYELPGLVSLEAASYSKNVVATRYGTAANYLGARPFFCSPWDEDSIRNAVTAAYYAPVPGDMKEIAQGYSWDATIEATVQAYESVLGRSIAVTQDQPVTSGWYDAGGEPSRFTDVLEQGEVAAKNMDFDRAHEFLIEAEKIDPTSVRVLKARGAVYLAESKIDEARVYFERALIRGSDDPKVLSGRGMCEMLAHQPGKAMPYFIKALQNTPDHLVALHQLVDCAYQLGTFDELEHTLERYLQIKPSDYEMQYCLAGCYYKKGKNAQAKKVVEEILRAHPNHVGSKELMERIVAGEKPVPQPVVSNGVPQWAVAPRPTSPNGGSLTELAERIKDWRIPSPLDTSATRPAPAQPVGGPLGVEVIREPALGQANQPMHDLESRMFKLEDDKREKRWDEVMEGIRSLQSAPLNPTQRARVKTLEAEMMVVQDDLVGADMLYDLILKETPGYPRALCGKGALAAEGHRWAEAREYFERALAHDDKSDIAIAGLGLCEMVADNSEEAFRLFVQAAHLNPENPRALLGVMQLGYPLKKYAQIESAINAYLELHPANIDMLYSLAGVLFAQGRVREANAEVEKILLFEPSHERARELQTMIRENTGGISSASL